VDYCVDTLLNQMIRLSSTMRIKKRSFDNNGLARRRCALSHSKQKQLVVANDRVGGQSSADIDSLDGMRLSLSLSRSQRGIVSKDTVSL
jgi:hypothetical protein